jgi:LDH2 family malate/lactate/ureidoglycolate dehydrogenase
MAIRLDLFRPAEDFKQDMSAMLDALSSLSPAEGASRVYYAGQKEQEAEAESNARGVPVEEGVWESIKSLAEELGVAGIISH